MSFDDCVRCGANLYEINYMGYKLCADCFNKFCNGDHADVKKYLHQNKHDRRLNDFC